ncbi:nicotinamide riboside transporter PnuC [Taibaiella chishuiensis]|uniref:Nicotinamide riboside transporter PnuC n=1 Tax=Taibaiella chishuiensis TaxID=1434707 RepID=A0A2P8DC50_9BACT|nr:nicotinamide riboside transporter PnuC [Taibaiella chishuiensis]PSK94803.1 nicotinamide mononucleotide transporter [Taibaiella chishuiensis]
MPDIYPYMIEQWQQTSWLELVAVFFSVVQVLLSYRNNVLLYPAGIIATGIYTWMLAQPHPGLYADATLNLYYFIMSIYGWYLWVQKTKATEPLPITRCSPRDWKIALSIAGLAFLVFFVLLKYATPLIAYITPSNVPVADALVAATAWSGMWLLARRKLENWILLNISNAIAIPLFFYKHMPLTALLTLFLFTVAVFGYFRWKKLVDNKASSSGIA